MTNSNNIPEARVVPMRLQKFLARAGAASRRGSENLMTAGRVSVNGLVVTELGSKVDPLVDEVRVDGEVVRLTDGATTLVLHKPAGYLTTMSDPRGRPVVAELVPRTEYPGLFPIGRLDFDTTGLLLFSTDGELGHGLLHPRRQVMKYYFALVEGVPSAEQIQKLCEGVELDDGPTLPAHVAVLHGVDEAAALAALDVNAGETPYTARQHQATLREKRTGRSVVSVGIREGRKRQVKRMLSFIGHPVIALHRTSFGPLALDGVPRGSWRLLTAEEVVALQSATQSS